MGTCVRGLRVALAVFVLLGSLVPAVDAKVSIVWARKRLPPSCEPPRVFYSNQHIAGRSPCCPTIEGLCAGGLACPITGTCLDGKPCAPTPVTNRPNIVLFIADDQGYCHYGDAGECRSSQTGTAIPVPKTPNLDLLSGHGTVFPIAHDTAGWCFPSLASILTARYQKNFHGERKVLASIFSTIPAVLRGLQGDPTAQNDPYNAGNKIGGYCTLLAGKFTGSLDESSFDAVAKTSGRQLGRNQCLPGAPGEPPACGTSLAPYQPLTVGSMRDVFNFVDTLLYAQPGTSPKQYAMQHFFLWYAPRIPHEPLRPPLPVMDYLFGSSGTFPLGGAMNLAQYCNGPTCPAAVTAFDENNFGTVRDYYGNVWWGDDNVRELREFLAKETAAHCIGNDGRSRFEVTTPAACAGVGTWSTVTPDLERNTIIMHLSDNGWQLPNSKHAFTENAYRTRVIVYDPQNLPTLPSWDPTQETAPPANTSIALAHAIDMLPTALGYAVGTPPGAPCPVGPDGIACDGHDLRPHLFDAPGGPAAPETLRRSICGHQTKRPTVPTRNRYLLTRPGSVGRCTNTASAACTTSADCPPNRFCLGGRCANDGAPTPCASTAACGPGAICVGGFCRVGPVCLDDTDCASMLGPSYVCTAKAQNWCRNAPNVACSTANDCPSCPATGPTAAPCSRLCETRSLKFYVEPGSVASVQLADLFLDPDEHGLDQGNTTSIINDMSKPNGPYAGAMSRLNCCIDDWWPEIVSQSGTTCQAGDSCPADLTCNE
jgi:hypothetical protein